MEVLVVRHAEPTVSAGLDPGRWPLSDADREAARDLGALLPRTGRRVSST